MNYKNFSTEDFLGNEEFVKWVVNPTNDLDIFWKKWFEAHPDKKEEAMRAREILKSLAFKVKGVDSQQYNEVLHKILADKYSDRHTAYSPVKSQKSVDRRMTFATWTRVAAVVALLVSFGWVLYFELGQPEAAPVNPEIQTLAKVNPKGQKSTFALSDGTIVTLNSESRLTFPSRFVGSRTVELEGEAFFDVAKNVHLPFIVKSKSIETAALGTSFNVKAFEEDEVVAVSLVTGKVLVREEAENSGHEEVYLSPGEKILYNPLDGTHFKTELTNADYAWKEGTLTFQQAGLPDFVKAIERWYGVTVSLQGHPANKWSVSGSFTNETLRVVLESICFTEDITYDLKHDEVTLIFTP